jgi:four helix bundle protein
LQELLLTQTFRDLIAWQKARALAREVYSTTRNFPEDERFGMVAQLRRAAVSIPSNIAEGRGRGTRKDFRHFLVQARGSLYETETQIDLASDFHYISSADAERLLGACDELSRILNGLINSIN